MADAPDASRDDVLHDVIIIGGGPCGLAVAARLREHTPSALFTEDEHARYHWIRKHGQHANILHKRSLRAQDAKPLPTARASGDDAANTTDDGYDVLVLDATAPRWMARWHAQFRRLAITHLRSPMFFHVDPGDRDSLLALAHDAQAHAELREIRGCVGKEVSKHRRKKRAGAPRLTSSDRTLVDERDRKDYFVPSRELFAEHCARVVSRYGLDDGTLRHERVADVAYAAEAAFPGEPRVFRVATGAGVRFARSVVVAVGHGEAPVVAPALRPLLRCGLVSCACDAGLVVPSGAVRARVAAGMHTQIVIVGGGLTSAQMADLAIRRGVARVWLLTRGELKVKPFDVDQAWISKYRNHKHACFWSADTDEERAQEIRAARNGGSITPHYHAVLRAHMAAGALVHLPHTQLASATLSAAPSRRRSSDSSDEHSGDSGSDDSDDAAADKTRLRVTTTPPHAGLAAAALDHAYIAAGMSGGPAAAPFLRRFFDGGGEARETGATTRPAPAVGNLPVLTEDLAIAPDVPLFVTGALAGLRLGPGAGNLGGARAGAERVAWGVVDALGRGAGTNGSGGYEAFAAGGGNRFEGLDGDEDEDGGAVGNGRM